ncbi:unnamed protein product [Callosobruchus maculatus]|uniref:LITAF domain-containing protein n=1 Tax=Callosobruchus maculatus TaxID=64391 RepID=A0A653D956_CALMS|nr:unnamed protein product [Callosobruchus maculatus]
MREHTLFALFIHITHFSFRFLMAHNTGPSPSPTHSKLPDIWCQCCQPYIKHKTHILHAPFFKKKENKK